MSEHWSPADPLNRRRGKPSLALSGELPSNRVLAQASEIGLVRTEYVVRRSKAFWTVERCAHEVFKYYEQLLNIVGQRMVWYRLSDLEARDVNVLEGCDAHIVDDNPIIGLRSHRRRLLSSEALSIELQTVAQLAKGRPNLGLILPFCRDANEVQIGIDAARAAGYPGPIGAMLEIPSAVYDWRAIVGLDVRHLIVGLNDLTGMLLATNRTDPHYSHSHPAVVQLVRALLNDVMPGVATVRLAGNYGRELIQEFHELEAGDFIVHYSDWGRMVDPDVGDYMDRGLSGNLRKESDRRLVDAGLMSIQNAVVAAGMRPG